MLQVLCVSLVESNTSLLYFKTCLFAFLHVYYENGMPVHLCGCKSVCVDVCMSAMPCPYMCVHVFQCFYYMHHCYILFCKEGKGPVTFTLAVYSKLLVKCYILINVLIRQ